MLETRAAFAAKGGEAVANKYTKKGKRKAGEPEPVSAGPDEFVSFWGKAYDTLAPHFREVVIALGAAAVLIVGLWIFLSVREGVREEATEMFTHAVRVYEADLLPADAKDAEKVKIEDDVPRFKTAEERARSTLEAIAKLEKAHGSAQVSTEAQAFRAGVLYDLGKFDKSKYDEARAIADKFAGDAAKDDPIKAIALEDKGLVLEDKGQLDDAMAAFKDAEVKGGDFYKERAIYDEARILVKKGDKDGAKKLYKQILDKMPTGLLHEEVQSRLTAIGG